ncbi:hypothetical protein [Mucilaginibacter sp.]|jgi:hypothetical protein|uniref:hypothetical protein n=1 Tax=Mucilaginibacter sp. TaxID=1882438 RepID=UPI0035690E71
MKTLITLLLLLFNCTVFSQTVLVKGVVKDTLTHRDEFLPIRVILNDTISKQIHAMYKTLDKLHKLHTKSGSDEASKLWTDSQAQLMALFKNTNYVVIPKKNGEFKIKAKLTDNLIFTSNSFITQKHAVSDLIKQKVISIKMEPEVCTPIEHCDEKRRIHVFIAEKIAVKRVDLYYCNYVHIIDGRYESKYKIIKNMYGDYKGDTISFVAFDHYGTPPFSKYKYVMIFVNEGCGKFTHEKYQFFDVYPTADGRWASPGDPYRYDQKLVKKVPPVKLSFKDSLSFDVSNEYPHIINKEYPEPYFKIENGRAFPLTGAYAEDLFEIKKNGVLKAIGYNLE